MLTYESWGRYHKFQHQVRFMTHHTDTLPLDSESRVLPYGLGRSYGDSCLNDEGTLIDTHHMNRFLAFDRHEGIIRCEAGCSLAEILQFIVPRGWFLPVTPGTKFVTLGGAIANDVHGKNHHRAGNFGHHVRQFELLRSDGKRYLCSPAQNSDLFRATIGGLGLTGLITWAEFRLKPIQSPYIDVEVIKFKNLDEFFALSSESEAGYDYIVSWIDCLATGKHLGKGLFTRGNNAVPPFTGPISGQGADSFLVAPFDAPNFILNKFTVRLFNFAYYHKQRQDLVQQLSHYDPFFYPLDSVGHWNRIYGQRGFMQHQCVVPYEGDDRAIRTIIDKIARSGLSTFLVVLKTFSDIPAIGMLSFPRQGVTLALDFPNQGQVTLDFLETIDQIVKGQGGVVYPAKDARMSAESFQTFYPQWQEFSQYVDPLYSSSFWRRVTREWKVGVKD